MTLTRNFLTLCALSFILGTGASLQAQQHDWCASDEVRSQLLQENGVEAQSLQQANQLLSRKISRESKTEAVVRTVPVVVHVIYATANDNISTAQIKDGIRILNEDYRRINSDTSLTRSIFKNVTADVEIEFKLAGKDPQGNCTDGITRTQSPRSLKGNNNVKDLIHWDNDRYYNIWVTRRVRETERGSGGNTILGYSSFPQVGSQNYRNDGTVMRHDEFGSIGTSVADGRTLTHETGHYFGLLHPFQSFQGGNGCTAGDQVADTPPVASANYGCNLGVNSCHNDSPDLPDQIENYMDYASCVNMFTQGQKTRMTNAITSTQLRNKLVSTNNLSLTGVTNPPTCKPEAKFEAPRRNYCTGEAVTFNDLTEEGEPSSWQWKFEAGTPATSTAQNPTVTYANPGNYDVTLISTNSAGTDSLVLEDYIYIKKGTQPFFDKRWMMSFELNYVPFTISRLDYGANGGFELFTNAGSEGDQSLRLDKTDYPGEIDEVISPAISTKGGQDLTMTYDIAHAAQQNSNTDRLEVLVSRDCGITWTLRRFYQGFRLRTAPNTTGDFVPSASEWTTETLPFDAYIQDAPILVKFKYESGGGNNFYLDNIRFGEGRDIGQEEVQAGAQFQAYPNPAGAKIILETERLEEELEVRITDLSGRTVFEENYPGRAEPSRQELHHELPDGMYILHLSSGARQKSEKLRIQH